VKKWGEALTGSGDILFYGCDLAATAQGQSLMQAVARLTGADVAASEDPTGAAAKGGDWDLEFNTGAIEAPVVVSLPPNASGITCSRRSRSPTPTTRARARCGQRSRARTAPLVRTPSPSISRQQTRTTNAATGTWTITVGTAASGNTALPTITSAGGAVTIDGSTQPATQMRP